MSRLGGFVFVVVSIELITTSLHDLLEDPEMFLDSVAGDTTNLVTVLASSTKSSWMALQGRWYSLMTVFILDSESQMGTSVGPTFPFGKRHLAVSARPVAFATPSDTPSTRAAVFTKAA